MSAPTTRQPRTRPAKLLTMSPEAWERLDLIALRAGLSRSATVESLVRAAARRKYVYIRCTGCNVENMIATEPSDGWVCGACGRHLTTGPLS